MCIFRGGILFIGNRNGRLEEDEGCVSNDGYEERFLIHGKPLIKMLQIKEVLETV
jgi:hypothetical protein